VEATILALLRAAPSSPRTPGCSAISSPSSWSMNLPERPDGRPARTAPRDRGRVREAWSDASGEGPGCSLSADAPRLARAARARRLRARRTAGSIRQAREEKRRPAARRRLPRSLASPGRAPRRSRIGCAFSTGRAPCHSCGRRGGCSSERPPVHVEVLPSDRTSRAKETTHATERNIHTGWGMARDRGHLPGDLATRPRAGERRGQGSRTGVRCHPEAARVAQAEVMAVARILALAGDGESTSLPRPARCASTPADR